MSKVDKAYQQIKEAILNGQYRPSQRLAEEDLAATLGMSRNTIRLALGQLEKERLVESEAFKGKRVAVIDLDETLQILEARELLEGYLAGRAAENMEVGALHELAEILQRMEIAQSQEKFDQYSRLNGRFHHVIHQVAQKPVISQFISDLRTRLIRFQYRTVLVPGRAAQSFHEHQQIYAALAAHDVQAADAAMRLHVAHVRQTILTHQTLLDLGGEIYIGDRI